MPRRKSLRRNWTCESPAHFQLAMRAVTARKSGIAAGTVSPEIDRCRRTLSRVKPSKNDGTGRLRFFLRLAGRLRTSSARYSPLRCR